MVLVLNTSGRMLDMLVDILSDVITLPAEQMKPALENGYGAQQRLFDRSGQLSMKAC